MTVPFWTECFSFLPLFSCCLLLFPGWFLVFFLVLLCLLSYCFYSCGFLLLFAVVCHVTSVGHVHRQLEVNFDLCKAAFYTLELMLCLQHLHVFPIIWIENCFDIARNSENSKIVLTSRGNMKNWNFGTLGTSLALVRPRLGLSVSFLPPA